MVAFAFLELSSLGLRCLQSSWNWVCMKNSSMSLEEVDKCYLKSKLPSGKHNKQHLCVLLILFFSFKTFLVKMTYRSSLQTKCIWVVAEILILKQIKKPLLITCRSSMNNVKVRSLCLCSKSEQNEKFMNVMEVSNYSRCRLQAVVKARAAQALVFQKLCV